MILYTHISLHGLAHLLNDNEPHIGEVMDADYVVPAEELDHHRRERPGRRVVELVDGAGNTLIDLPHYDTTYRLGCNWERVIIPRQPRVVFRSVDGSMVTSPVSPLQERFWGPEQVEVWRHDPETELGPHAVMCLACKRMAAYCLYERPMYTSRYKDTVRLRRYCDFFTSKYGLIFYRKFEWVLWARTDRILPWTTAGLGSATPEELVSFDQLLSTI